MIKKILFVTILFLWSVGASSQVVGFLPDDPKVVCGTLPNGLAYYLVSNSVSNGFADFSFIQKTGLAMETKQTAGMTYLMECMALTETKNFPDGTLFTFIDDIGLGEDGDFILEAEDYYTSYSFRNVPLNKNALIVDSLLMALYNISSGVIINESSVARAKSFFKNIFSAAMTMDKRVQDSVARFFYAGTPLAPIPDKELFQTIEKYTVRDVQRFYNHRCRPDMQAIVISGDIDIASVQSKLNTLFQLVPKSSGDTPEFIEPNRYEATNGFFYFQDVEADCATVTIDYVVDHINRSLRGTAVPLVYDYMSQLSMNIMENRFRRNLESASFYAIDVDASVLNYLNKQSFRFTVKCAPADYAKAYTFLLTEIRRMVEYGITDRELKQEKDRFFFYLSNLFESRSSLGNEYYTEMCIENFTNDYSMVGVEWYKTYIEAADSSLDAKRVGDFISTVLKDKRNRIVTCTSPEHTGGLEYFTADVSPIVLDTVVEVKKHEHNLTKNKQGQEENFINQFTGVTSRRLTNGATVAFKPLASEVGWVYFEAVARGGLSLSENNLAAFSGYIDDVAKISLVGGKNVYERIHEEQSAYMELYRRISVENRKIVGKFHKDYIYRFLEIVSEYFKGSAPDDENFEKYRSMMTGCAPYVANSPEKYFELLHGSDIQFKGEDNEEDAPSVEALNYRDALEFVNVLFSNVAEFSFIFVGDIPEEELMDAVSRHIESIPGRPAARRRMESSRFYIASYDKTEIIEVPMSFPRAYHSYRLTFPSESNVENRALTEITAKALECEVVRQLSLHGILANADYRFYRYPKEVITIDFQFTTDKYEPQLEGLFAEIVMRLADLGVDENEVGRIRQNIIVKEQLRENRDHDYWIRLLRNRYIDRKDFYSKRKDALNAVTAERVNQLLKVIVEDGRLSQLSVVPKE